MGFKKLGLGAVLLLYGAIVLAANPAAADFWNGDSRGALESLRRDDMKRLIFHETPYAAMKGSYSDKNGNNQSIADFRGKVVLLNFWATWCPPCREEMPSIDRLAGVMNGDDIAVIAVSTDNGGMSRVQDFYQDTEIAHLPAMLDSNKELIREAGVLGMPTTVILDRQGREIARYTGSAQWDTDSVKAILRKVAELDVE